MPFNPPPPWTNGPLLLYHGTLDIHVASISTPAAGRASGVNPALGRPRTDFGKGFYTTTSLDQAESWAWQLASTARASGSSGVNGGVITFQVDREQLSTMDFMAFVRGDRHAADYWSFVHYCRSGGTGHGRAASLPLFYDVVSGPLSASWRQRTMIQDADQISFHSVRSAALLAPSSTHIITLP